VRLLLEETVKHDDALSGIERVQEHGALPDLEALVNEGCDREELVAALETSFVVDESWQTLIGMGLPQFKRALKQIQSCADIIDRLNRTDLVFGLSVDHVDPLFAALHQSPTLPERLREYVAILDHRRGQFGPKRNLRAHIWKASIVAIVMEDTRSPHDEEVSAVVGAVLNRPKYSVKAHQKWRTDHEAFIEMMRAKLQERRHRRSSALPPI
jgi:hypothetical protein